MQYLSDISLAARLDIGRSTVWLWCKQGKLPQPIKLNGTRTRWRLTDIAEWEKQQGGAA